MSKCYLYGSGGGSAAVGSEIEVTAPTGSTVVCSLEGIVKTAQEQNGIWLFRGCDVGTWTVTAVLGDESATETVVIREEDRRFRYRTELSYRTWPDSFDLAAYGTKGVNYQVVGADDAELLPADYRKDPGWKLRLLTGGTLIARKKATVDVFCVGGGGGTKCTNSSTSGAGGGCTKTGKGITMTPGTSYSITVGAGGAGTAGGNTSALGITANGGKACTDTGNGGSGGSGGGRYGATSSGGAGGSDGSDGGSSGSGSGAAGQGTTTREFGESTGKLYAGGGGGGYFNTGSGGAGGSGGGAACGASAAANTGGGAGGFRHPATGTHSGGSGIVVIRNAKG